MTLTDIAKMNLRYNCDGLLWDAAIPSKHNVVAALTVDHARLFAAAPAMIAALQSAIAECPNSAFSQTAIAAINAATIGNGE